MRRAEQPARCAGSRTLTPISGANEAPSCVPLKALKAKPSLRRWFWGLLSPPSPQLASTLIKGTFLFYHSRALILPTPPHKVSGALMCTGTSAGSVAGKEAWQPPHCLSQSSRQASPAGLAPSADLSESACVPTPGPVATDKPGHVLCLQDALLPSLQSHGASHNLSLLQRSQATEALAC